MKKRLDILVFVRGFAESREKAKAIIMAGKVYVDNQKADKCCSGDSFLQLHRCTDKDCTYRSDR